MIYKSQAQRHSENLSKIISNEASALIQVLSTAIDDLKKNRSAKKVDFDQKVDSMLADTGDRVDSMQSKIKIKNKVTEQEFDWMDVANSVFISKENINTREQASEFCTKILTSEFAGNQIGCTAAEQISAEKKKWEKNLQSYIP